MLAHLENRLCFEESVRMVPICFYTKVHSINPYSRITYPNEAYETFIL